MRVGSGLRPMRRLNVSFTRHSSTHLVVQLLILGSERGKPIHIPVIHAEGRGNENGVVNFEIRSAFLPRSLDVLGEHSFAVLLNLPRDLEKRLELRANRRMLMVETDCIDQFVISVEVMRGGRSVARLAKIAIVSGRDECGDHLTFATR